MFLSHRYKKALLYGCLIELPLAAWLLMTPSSYGIPLSMILHLPGLFIAIPLDTLIKPLKDVIDQHEILKFGLKMVGYLVIFGSNAIIFSLIALCKIPKDNRF